MWNIIIDCVSFRCFVMPHDLRMIDYRDVEAGKFGCLWNKEFVQDEKRFLPLKHLQCRITVTGEAFLFSQLEKTIKSSKWNILLQLWRHDAVPSLLCGTAFHWPCHGIFRIFVSSSLLSCNKEKQKEAPHPSLSLSTTPSSFTISHTHVVCVGIRYWFVY